MFKYFIMIKLSDLCRKTLINPKISIPDMKKKVLPNGLTVIFKKKRGNLVVVEVMVKVGSNYERSDEKGISHFLEHILFEGTPKRPANRDISNEIEKIGGDFNAYTSNEKTCFYVKVLKKHFGTAIDVLADVLQNSLFKEKDIAKEKNVVLKEIDLVNDDPRHYQWILLQKVLFEKHPCRFPTYGDKKVVKNLTRDKVLDFFKRYYVPNNMAISIVGDVKNWKKEVEKKFVFKKGRDVSGVKVKEPVMKRNKIRKEKKNINNTHLLLGFKTIPRKNKDSYILDVINGILGRGQSGRMFTEIRSKKGLAYDVGTQNFADMNTGYFAVYASIDRKNVELVKRMMLKELQNLEKVSTKDLKEAVDFLEGYYSIELEDTQKMADQLLFWEQVEKAENINKYLKNIKKVTVNGVKRVAKKYFKNYAMVVLEGK